MPETSDSAASQQQPASPQVASPEVTQPQLPQLTAMPVKPGEDLPDPLPAGAHRVISTLAAAEMRKMMEGVVLFGTGKAGAAQRLLVRRQDRDRAKDRSCHAHLFEDHAHCIVRGLCAGQQSRHRRRRSFMDSPKGAYYGADVSAPVFAEVAQQVLEYLGVPHDIDLRPDRPPHRKKSLLSRKTMLRRRAKILRRFTRLPTICPATIRCGLRLNRRLLQIRNPRRRPCRLQVRRPATLPARRPSTPLPCPRKPLRNLVRARLRIQWSSPTPHNFACHRFWAFRCAR